MLPSSKNQVLLTRGCPELLQNIGRLRSFVQEAALHAKEARVPHRVDPTLRTAIPFRSLCSRDRLHVGSHVGPSYLPPYGCRAADASAGLKRPQSDS